MNKNYEHSEALSFPRVMISALSGGAGKTILSIGIIAALINRGKDVAPFKKGPDYIDAGWLALTAGRKCYNLDTFLVSKKLVIKSFISRSIESDFALVEGNRGLYDGIDTEGSTSAAELSKLIDTPVILCVDCTKSTRTMAAAILGCIHFDPNVDIKGVVLNRVAGTRHKRILKKNIEYHCGLPVVGAIPKLKKQNFPERHMGLIPTFEHDWAKEAISYALKMAKKHLDIEKIIHIAIQAKKLKSDNSYPALEITDGKSSSVSISNTNRKFQRTSTFQKPIIRIGVIKDSAFQFYYPENLEALCRQGAQLEFISPISDKSLPKLDALYLGGGFPETHLEALSGNMNFMEEIRRLVEDGFPIYAECGGLIYLGHSVILNDKSYKMANVFPVEYSFSKKPAGHGYTILKVENKNPYFEVGTEIRGHEFHYSMASKWSGNDDDLVFKMKRGVGFHSKRDGLCYKNVLALYTHIHALGTPQWATAIIRKAVGYKKQHFK